eukprot:gene1531-1869_t
MTRRAMSRSNIVINLIGANLETMNFSFEDVHAAWPEKLAKMAAESEVAYSIQQYNSPLGPLGVKNWQSEACQLLGIRDLLLGDPGSFAGGSGIFCWGIRDLLLGDPGSVAGGSGICCWGIWDLLLGDPGSVAGGSWICCWGIRDLLLGDPGSVAGGSRICCWGIRDLLLGDPGPGSVM